MSGPQKRRRPYALYATIGLALDLAALAARGTRLDAWTLLLLASAVVLVAYLRRRVEKWRADSVAYAAATDTARTVATMTRATRAATAEAGRAAHRAATGQGWNLDTRSVRVASLTAQRWNAAAPAASDELRKRAEKGRSVGRVLDAHATPSGERFTVKLPRGVHADSLDASAIASVLDANTALLSQGKSARYVDVRVRRFDTLAEPRRRPPRDPEAAWSPRVTIGVDEDGDPVVLDFGAAHGVLGGASRGGKSALGHGLIEHWADNPDAALYVWDGKGGAELGKWRKHTAFFHDGVGVGLDGARRVQRMVDARFDRLVELGRENAAGDYAAFPPVLVFVDEVGAYSTQGRDAKALLEVLRDVMMRGLAVHVTVVLASQKPTDDSIPSGLSALAENRVAFKCGSLPMSTSILVDAAVAIHAVRDLPAPESSEEGKRRTAGRFVVVGSGGGVRFGRTFYADPAELAASVPGRSDASLAEHPPEGGEARARRAGADTRARAREDDADVVIDVDVLYEDDHAAPPSLPPGRPVSPPPAAGGAAGAAGLGVGPWMPRFDGEPRSAWRRRRSEAWRQPPRAPR